MENTRSNKSILINTLQTDEFSKPVIVFILNNELFAGGFRNDVDLKKAEFSEEQKTWFHALTNDEGLKHHELYAVLQHHCIDLNTIKIKPPKQAVLEETTSGNDPYCDELEGRGFLTKTISPLEFSYKNLDLLQSKLSQPEQYSGIIFTSPRCVRAVVNAICDTDSLNDRWQELFTFAVGETTARHVKDNLGLDSDGSCAGNGASLAPIIISRKPSKPLLLPCGNIRTDTLETLLTQGRVETEAVEVYETVARPGLQAVLSNALSQHQPSYIVYFSPSGVDATLPLLRQYGLDFEKIKWVSIGPTTRTAMEACGLPVHCSAAKPTPQSLADAISNATTL